MMTKTTDEAQGQWVATAEQGISISTKAAAASVGVPAGSAAVNTIALVACFDADVHTCNCGAWLRTCGISTAKAEVIPVDRQAIAACFSIMLQSGLPKRATARNH